MLITMLCWQPFVGFAVGLCTAAALLQWACIAAALHQALHCRCTGRACTGLQPYTHRQLHGIVIQKAWVTTWANWLDLVECPICSAALAMCPTCLALACSTTHRNCARLHCKGGQVGGNGNGHAHWRCPCGREKMGACLRRAEGPPPGWAVWGLRDTIAPPTKLSKIPNPAMCDAKFWQYLHPVFLFVSGFIVDNLIF